MYIPPGVAHGFAALTDILLTYLVDNYYDPSDELGLAWDDPAVGADWGIADPILSVRDQSNPRRGDIPDGHPAPPGRLRPRRRPAGAPVRRPSRACRHAGRRPPVAAPVAAVDGPRRSC